MEKELDENLVQAETEAEKAVEETAGDAGSEDTAKENSGSPEKPDTPQKKSSKKKSSRKKKSAKRLAADFFIKLGLTVVIVWLLLSFVLAIYVNHSHAAYPMIKDGDFCLVYRLAKLAEGDEVAYKAEGEIKFGRIVAMPGDSVEIRGEVLMVNGYNVTTDVVYPTTSEGSEIEYPYKVPEGSYFILNDFRAEVTDSRKFGAVDKKNIKGKIIFIMRRRGI